MSTEKSERAVQISSLVTVGTSVGPSGHADQDEGEQFSGAAAFESETPESLDEHSSAITKLRAPPRTTLLLSASTDGTVRVWATGDTQSKMVLDATSFSAGAAGSMAKGAEAGGGTAAAAAVAADLRIEKRSSLGGGADGAGAAALGPSRVAKVLNIWADEGCDTIWAACSDGGTRVWAGADGKPIRLLKGHDDAITALEGWGGGQGSCIVGTGSVDRTLRIWDLRAKRPQAFLFRGHADTILALRWTEGGRTVVSASKDKTVRIWDTRAGRWGDLTNMRFA